MRVLVACEFSGVVRDAFAALGHDAWSCDVLPTESPGNHIQDDVLLHLGEDWDLMVAHPPCTYLTLAGVRHLHEHCVSRNGNRAKVHGMERWAAMERACEFFNALKRAPIPKIAVENPTPHRYATKLIGRYHQRIQPWEFGHPETKGMCLWLKNLPPLMATAIMAKREPRIHMMSPGPNRSHLRSVFFTGVASAMANQWGGVCHEAPTHP